MSKFLAITLTISLVACSAAPREGQGSQSSSMHASLPSKSTQPKFKPLLPDRKLTPGAINPLVTQDTISSTICIVGWTKTQRPSVSYTNHLKLHQLLMGYTYKGDLDSRHYEEDHLIPLELGGSPSNEQNLWPEPYSTITGAHTKDKLENKLKKLVCDGTLKLHTAQHAIATNWYAAYLRYIG